MWLCCRLAGFPEACIYPLLQMQFDAGAGTITNAPGVSTSIYDFGGQFCAAIPYEPLFAIAQAIGYTAGQLCSSYIAVIPGELHRAPCTVFLMDDWRHPGNDTASDAQRIWLHAATVWGSSTGAQICKPH